MRSTPSARSDLSHALRTYSGRPFNSHSPSGPRQCPNFVATRMSSLRAMLDTAAHPGRRDARPPLTAPVSVGSDIVDHAAEQVEERLPVPVRADYVAPHLAYAARRAGRRRTDADTPRDSAWYGSADEAAPSAAVHADPWTHPALRSGPMTTVQRPRPQVR